MERNEYILLCQKASIIQDKQQKEKYSVLLNGIEYFPYCYAMMFDKKGSALNVAILQDKKTDSIATCLIEQVERKEKND